jgi:hypothetical protein
MRFFHSYWSKPAERDRWSVARKWQTAANLWLFALSTVYLKCNRKEIVLHTDQAGEKLLSCLPYDNIYRSLDEIVGVNGELWCAGKLRAYEREALGCVHLDGDVFLKSPKTFQTLDMAGFDLLIQNTESTGDSYDFGYANLAKIYGHSRLPPPFAKWNDAYCCGITAFNNEKLKAAYINAAWRMIEIIQAYPALAEMTHGGVDTAMVLIIEQMSLKYLTDTNAYRVKNLLDKNNICFGAGDIDYCHVIGKNKYAPSVINGVKAALKQLAYPVYAAVERRLQSVLDE